MVQSVVGVPDMQIPRMNEVPPNGEPTHFTLEAIRAYEELDRKLDRFLDVHVALESGFTLEIALECDQLLGGDELARVYFEPGRAVAKRQVALEAMDAGLIGVIVTAVAAALVLIGKMIYDFMGKGSKSESSRYAVSYVRLTQSQQEMAVWVHRYGAHAENIKRDLDKALQRKNAAMNKTPGQLKLDTALSVFNRMDFDIIEFGNMSQAVQKFVGYTLQRHPFDLLGKSATEAEELYRKLIKQARELADGADIPAFTSEVEKQYGYMLHRAWQTELKEMAGPVAHTHGLLGLGFLEDQDKQYSPQTMATGCIAAQKKIDFEEYSNKFYRTEPALTAMQKSMEEMKEELNQLRSSTDSSTWKGAAERSVLKAYHHWLSEHHTLLIMTLKALAGVAEYSRRLTTLPKRISNLTNAALEVVKENAKKESTRDGGETTTVDMGKVDEVQKDLNLIIK